MYRTYPALVFVTALSGFFGPAFGGEPNTSLAPGTVISHMPASAGRYVGSPAIAVLPDGTYAASHDEFGPESQYYTNAYTRVFNSHDHGETWTQVTRFEGALWSSLFVHAGALYLMGTHKEYGAVLIRRSMDSGKTWTETRDAVSGILAPGEYHTAPVPVIEFNGRLWRGFEDANAPGGWGERYRSLMMSAPVDADLLRADSWTMSRPLCRDTTWLDGTFRGWLEGNAVVSPQGELVNVLRVDYKPGPELAAMVHISADGKEASFDHTRDLRPFPGGSKKFTIRWDPVAKTYWALSNPVLAPHKELNPTSVRNALALISSPDLTTWEIRCIVLYHPDAERHAFQYVDWLFDGDDLIAVSRTASDDGLGGAPRGHDANFMTFHRIRDFRALTLADGAAGTQAMIR